MKIIEKNDYVCLLVSETTHTILCGNKYFENLILLKTNVHTISSPVKIIEGSRNTMIILPNVTILHLEDAFLSSRSKMNLLSFQDVNCNGYHLETLNTDNIDYI